MQSPDLNPLLQVFRVLTLSKDKTNSFWEVKLPRPQYTHTHTHTHTPQKTASSTPVPDVQGKGQQRPVWGGRGARGGASAGHRSPSGGAGIWPARPGSPSTLILLSARPGAGLGNVTFQRKLFPFSPQDRKRQKDKQTPSVAWWETGQHVGRRQAHPIPPAPPAPTPPPMPD